MTSQKGLNNFLTAYYYKVWGDKRWVRQYQNISVTWFVDDPWLRRLERRLPLSKWLYKKYVECESENTSRISIACSVRHGILSIMTSFWTALTRFPFGDRKVSPWQQKKRTLQKSDEYLRSVAPRKLVFIQCFFNILIKFDYLISDREIFVHCKDNSEWFIW